MIDWHIRLLMHLRLLQSQQPMNVLLVHASVARALVPVLKDLDLPIFLLAAEARLAAELKCSGALVRSAAFCRSRACVLSCIFVLVRC